MSNRTRMSVRLAEPNLEAIDEGRGIKESRKKKDHQPPAFHSWLRRYVTKSNNGINSSGILTHTSLT